MAPAKGGAKCKFYESQDVLARWNDGLFYLGTILNVDEAKERCYIQFEDDSEHWTLFKDIQQGPSKGEITCSLCQDGTSDPPNEIVLCDSCGIGYHQHCHRPAIGQSVLTPGVSWKCRLCVFASSAKKGGATKKGINAQAFQAMKQTLPYDLKSLTWDNHHKTNKESTYCYCGGPGDWYMKMLQCCRCKQWFHEACLQCLNKPLVYGDRFYVFVCSFCNSGPEYLTRLQPKWHDVAQLALFNLAVMTHKKYHHFEEKVVHYINTHWDQLQLGKLDNVDKADRPRKLLKALQLNVQRYCLDKIEICKPDEFQNARENKKCGNLWGLRVRVPPPAPPVVIPTNGVVTDEVFYGIEANKPKKKLSKSPQKDRKRKATDNLDEIKLRKSKKARTSFRMDSEEEMDQNVSPAANGVVGHAVNGQESSTAEKQGPSTLDTIIPWPSSYEGLNHPFKTVLECNEEIQHEKIKEKLLSSYHQNGALSGSEESDSRTEETTEDSDSQSVSMGEENMVSQAVVAQTVSSQAAASSSSAAFISEKPRGKKRGRKSKAELLAIAETEARAKALAKEQQRVQKKKRLATEMKLPIKTPHHAKNVVDKSTLDSMRQREVPINQLRSSVSCYFGAVDRLKNGQRFQMLARRVTPDGKVQYLIEWEGSFLG